MTQEDYKEYRVDLDLCKYGCSRKEAEERLYEIKIERTPDEDERFARENPEAYLEDSAKRLLISDGVALWEQYAEAYRTLIPRLNFYIELAEKLPLRQRVDDWMKGDYLFPKCALFNIGSAVDAYEYLCSIKERLLLDSVVKVAHDVIFENNNRFEDLSKWCEKIERLIEKGLPSDYKKDILENKKDYKMQKRDDEQPAIVNPETARATRTIRSSSGVCFVS